MLTFLSFIVGPPTRCRAKLEKKSSPVLNVNIKFKNRRKNNNPVTPFTVPIIELAPVVV